MSRGYARRQLVLAALAANAVRPMSRGWSSIPGFALGWPTSELAPHLLGAAAVDTAAELTVRRGKPSKPSEERSNRQILDQVLLTVARV